MDALWKFESELANVGFSPVCGVDEAGRGPLAGPVYAAAVLLPQGREIPGLADSKKLSPRVRDVLFETIIQVAVSFGVASATVEEIASLNILGATYLAMNRAIAQLKPAPALALIDGNRDRGIQALSCCVVRGDESCASIAAASILAKVSRDRYMQDLALKYPGYGFERHKGYGTVAHYAALRKLGPCPAHRALFLRKMH